MSDSDDVSDYNHVSEFLKAFPTYHLHRKRKDEEYVWVFCSQDEGGGSQNYLSSADRQTTGTIQHKIKSALSRKITSLYPAEFLLVQFWAPVEIGGRQLLSTSGQPFAVNCLDNNHLKYRQRSTEYEESNPMIITSSLPVIAFLNRLHSFDTSNELVFSILIPICCPAQSSSSCVGVIEYSLIEYFVVEDLRKINTALQETGLSIFGIQERIPYKTVYGLEPARIQIEKAIKTVCASYKIQLAQVWIANYEDENSVPFPSSLVYTRKKQMLALKLTGCHNKDTYNIYRFIFGGYYDLCDMVPLDTGESFVEKTLQDYGSRFYKTYDRLNKNLKLTFDFHYEPEVHGIVICLKSTGTGDCCYVFEFLWIADSDYVVSLGDLLLELKKCLPSFKFASGAELGEELHVIDVENSAESDITTFKIFEGKGESSMPEALEKGKKVMVMDDIAPPTYHFHRKGEKHDGLWDFCSQNEGGGSQNNSSSTDRQTTGTIQDKIKSALSLWITSLYGKLLFAQFWAPVEIGGRQLLSTSGQPFAVNYLDHLLVGYRQQPMEYEESNPLNITSSSLVTAFLNRLTRLFYISKDTNVTFTQQYAWGLQLELSVMIPICCPAQSSSSCVGVIECYSHPWRVGKDLRKINTALQETGLSIFGIQERIPYKTVYGLEPARIQIEKAIKTVCASYKIQLAQVWIANYEDENSVPFPSSLVYTQKKQMLALKLTGCHNKDMYSKYQFIFGKYYDLCDMVPLDTGESFVEKTLQDYGSRFYKTYDRLNKNLKLTFDFHYEPEVHGIVICLKSTSTGDFCYVFEFLWIGDSDYWVVDSNYVISLGDLLLELKKCLPSFKFASGAELGDELHVIDVENSAESDITTFKIFEGKGESSMPEALEKGKKVMVMDDIAPPKRKHRTAPKYLPQERIELQFGKTMKEAADNLKVSLSTLKRKCKDYGIKEWQGPSKQGKRNVNHSCNQSDTNEEDSGAILVSSTLERNGDTLTIKAENSDDMIKFDLLMSEATFVLIESKIGKRFKLTPGSYKLKYCDEDSDWILLTSEEDMSYCIRSSKKLDRTVVRLCVTA